MSEVNETPRPVDGRGCPECGSIHVLEDQEIPVGKELRYTCMDCCISFSSLVGRTFAK